MKGVGPSETEERDSRGADGGDTGIASVEGKTSPKRLKGRILAGRRGQRNVEDIIVCASMFGIASGLQYG